MNIYLEVYDHAEDEDGGHEVHEIGQILPIESLPESPDFVLSGGEEMEEGNHGSLELGASSGVDGSGGEGLPDDGLANVGGNEQRNTGSEAISLLEELVEEKDDETGDEQLDDDQEADTGADVGGLSVHAGHHVHDGLTNGDHHTEHCWVKGEEEKVTMGT